MSQLISDPFYNFNNYVSIDVTFSIIAKKECDLCIAIAEILHPDPDRLIFHKLCMD